MIGEVSRNSAVQHLSQQTTYFAQSERKALDAKQEFDQASRIVKTELARFEQERVEDFRDSLQAFLSGMIDRQKEVRKPLRCFWVSLLTCTGSCFTS